MYGLVALGLLSTVGCEGSSDSGVVPVTGTVKYKGKPIEGALVLFIPVEGTIGTGGSGTTASGGAYTIMSNQGKEGLPPGSYKVVISKTAMPDGSAPDPNVPPIESQAKETLPARYSSELSSTLTKAVSEGGGPIDFDLK